MRLKVLFITRNYLPKIGGLEVYGYNLIKEFEAHQITYKIALGKSKAHLIWFFPYCLVKALCIVRMHPIQLIHLCDGLLAPIRILLKLLAGARVSITIHGLDITYGNLFYQLIIPWCVARLDKVICVSGSTRDECVGRRIPKDKCAVIPNGVRPNEIYLPQPREDHRHGLGELLGVSLDDKIVLLTIGRLVERKGVAWFVENVMPHLHPSYHYLIAGDGPQYRHIREVSVKRDLQERVLLLGTVSDEEKKRLFNASDILLMPNITVPHDVEGFGIVAIEAGSCGLPVIASNLQGIKDAVIDRKTGVLVEERDAEGYLREIKNMSLNRSEDLNGDFIVQFQHGLIDCRSKIKITLGLFTDDFYPHIGGIGRFVTEIASRLPENNLLIFSPCENKVSNHIQVEVAFHDIFKNLSFSFWLLQNVVHLVQKHRFSGINIQCGPGGLFLLKKLNTPVIATSHHTCRQQSHYICSQFWKKIFIPFEKRTYRLADRIICDSNDSKRILISKYHIPPDKMVVIPIGVDTCKFYPIGYIKKIQNRLLFVGRVDKRKGADFLIRTMPLVVREIPDVKLFLGGAGKDLSKLEV